MDKTSKKITWPEAKHGPEVFYFSYTNFFYSNLFFSAWHQFPYIILKKNVLQKIYIKKWRSALKPQLMLILQVHKNLKSPLSSSLVFTEKTVEGLFMKVHFNHFSSFSGIQFRHVTSPPWRQNQIKSNHRI